MPRIVFKKRFIHAPHRGLRILYEAGEEYLVTSACRDAATMAGVIESEAGNEQEGIRGLAASAVIVDEVDHDQCG